MVIGGDFNLTFDQSLDTEGYVREHKEKSKEFVKTEMQSMGLKDSYREVNGDRRQYTWERFAGDKRARLDHALVSGITLEGLSAMEMRHSPIQGFDHKALILCFGSKVRFSKPYFKAREGIEDDPEYRELMVKVVMEENLDRAEYERIKAMNDRQKSESIKFTQGWLAAPEFVLQQALQNCREVTANFSKSKNMQVKEERR